MILLLTIGIRTGSVLYVEASLIIALLGFAGTVALSKFLMRGQVIE
jgi:multicomponent K+:H+ antiporter subunit F